MPDPNEPSESRYVVPDKLRTYDDVAMAQLNEAADERERHRAEATKHAADQETKAKAIEKEQLEDRKASARRGLATGKPGPAERMVGDALQNTPERVAGVTPPSPQLTAAQLEMKAKREAARLKDREIVLGQREPEKVPELPRSTDGRSR